MNQVIETILSHASVRDYQNKLLSREQIETIVRCAQRASTSSYMQAYSIIGVGDPKIKRELAEIAKQQHVESCGHLFIFCADLFRHQMIGDMEQKDVIPSIESTEKFMVAVIDAAIAAQNAAIAAESMGLGICYIGGLRNDLDKVSKLLKLPERVIPLFGMTVGYPAKRNEKKPRLPLEHVYQENHYLEDEALYVQQLEEFNRTTHQYYKERTDGKREDRWTKQISSRLENPVRMYMKDFVENKGLNKR